MRGREVDGEQLDRHAARARACEGFEIDGVESSGRSRRKHGDGATARDDGMAQ